MCTAILLQVYIVQTPFGSPWLH